MTTNVQGRQARELPFQVVHTLRKTVNFNDPGIAAGIPFPVFLPAGAEILFAQAKVKVAFNAATTNVLTVGTAAGSNADILAAADITEGSVGASALVTTGAALTFANDTQIFAQYTQSGAAATAGRATLIIAYVVNNDQ